MSKPRLESFAMGDVFVIEKGKRLEKSNQISGETRFIGASEANHGLTARIGQDPLFDGGRITVAYNGAVGSTFYQPLPFWASDDINVLSIRDFAMDEFVGMYLCTVIGKMGNSFHYGRKWNVARMRNTNISLPIQLDVNSNPVIDSEHTYHSKGFVPDWDYMRERIRELEQARIRELVMYLKVTGLDDCVLTDEDQAVLAAWREQTPPCRSSR